MRENPDDIIDPFMMIKLFRTLCPPEQVRFFCRAQTPKMEHARRTNTVDGILVPILYKTSPRNVMGEMQLQKKQENWQKYVVGKIGKNVLITDFVQWEYLFYIIATKSI